MDDKILETKADIEVIKLLLDRVTDINAKDNNGANVLMQVVKEKASIEVVELLLKSGADINVKDEVGATVLIHAVWHKASIEIVELLLKSGADINAKNNNGSTALKFARSKEIINLLLDYGANPIMIMSNNNLIPSMGMVIAMDEIVRKNRLKKNMLMYVLEAGKSSKEVKPLLDKLGDIKNMHDINGKTPLMYAIEGKMNKEILDLLITHGANIKETTNTGKTLIMYAVQNSNYHMVQRLCEKGADINARDNNGNTALMYAIMDTNNCMPIKPLLDLGANVGDESIINMAKKYRGPHIVRILNKKLQQERQENMQQMRPKRSIEGIVLQNGHSPKKRRYK